MQKQELLKSIQEALEAGLLTREELQNFSKEEKLAPMEKSEGWRSHSPIGISEILSYLGGLIIFIGIAIFFSQKWEYLSGGVKILATLGTGLAAYVSAVLLSRYENFSPASMAFHLLAALLIPGGIFVALDVAHISGGAGLDSLVFAALLVFYLASFFVFRKNLFLFLSILFGTAVYFLFVEFLLDTGIILSSFLDGDLNFYRVLIAGLAYLFLGYAFSKIPVPRSPSLLAFLNGFGAIMFLGAGIALGGYFPDQNAFWEIVFPGIALGTIFLSLPAKSRAYLVFGTLFLMGYIFKITAEYFSEGLGWSLSLVIIGLFCIAIGYLSLGVNKKYALKNQGR